jgi:hypothetical protein
VHDAVDEESRRAAHLTRRQTALDVSPNPPQDIRAGSILVEAGDVEPELGGIPPQVLVVERLLAMEEQLMHVPEPAL